MPQPAKSKSQKSKNKKNLIYVVVILLMLLVSGYIFLGNFASDSQSTPDFANLDIDIDAAVTEELVGESGQQQRSAVQRLLGGLIKFGNWPVQVNRSQQGRSNPFLPAF